MHKIPNENTKSSLYTYKLKSRSVLLFLIHTHIDTYSNAVNCIKSIFSSDRLFGDENDRYIHHLESRRRGFELCISEFVKNFEQLPIIFQLSKVIHVVLILM